MTANMSQLKRIGGMTLATVGLATVALTIGAYSGGTSGANDAKPPVTTALPAVNCTAPPSGVAAADWCPGGR